MAHPRFPDPMTEQALRRQIPNVKGMIGQEPEALARYAQEEQERKARLEKMIASGGWLSGSP